MRGRRAAGWVYVTAAALLSGLCVVLTRWWAPGAMASGAAAAAAVVAGVWAARGAAVSQERASRRQAGAWQVRLDERGRLPLVADVPDPVSVGVHPAGPGSGGRVPAFVRRDGWAGLCEALLRDRFVLLVGESAAGKSRMAYEAVRELLPGRRLVVPAVRDGLRAALDLAMEHPGCVLWLDDLERFLGDGGLTGAAVRNLLAGPGQPRYVITTMRAQEHARFIAGTGIAVGQLAGDGWRASREVLYLAAVVTVPRRWSPAELARAAAHRDDPRIAEALEHAGQFGVGEYLVAGPQLLASWQDAWAPGTHPRGAALVLAAVDARRAGISRPLPARVLARLHESYLEARGGLLLRPEPLQGALEWATTPLHATSSLLLPVGEQMLLAFDYLIDAIPRDPLPATAVEVLTGYATCEEAMEIGLTAWYWGQQEQAEAAFARAENGGRGPFAATGMRLVLIAERDGTAAALAFARGALASRTRELGPGHPDTFRARQLLLSQEGDAQKDADGRVHGAGQTAGRLMALHQDAVRLLGPESRTTLEIRGEAARWTGMGGDLAEAANLAAGLEADCERIFGKDDDITFACRRLLADCTRDVGNLDEGLRMLGQLIADAECRDGRHGQDAIDTRRARASWLAREGLHREAAREWQALITDLTASRGSLHANTLNSRAGLAEVIGLGGDPAAAVTILSQLVADAAQVSPESTIPMLAYRRLLADWTGEAGDPADAARQFQELAERSARQRGDDDYYTKWLRQRLAHWQTAAGTDESPIKLP